MGTVWNEDYGIGYNSGYSALNRAYGDSASAKSWLEETLKKQGGAKELSEAERLDEGDTEDKKELAKKVQAAWERWVNSPEYEVEISERARRKAEMMQNRQSPEEIAEIRNRGKYGYYTEHLGITTNRYGYAGIMEKAGSGFFDDHSVYGLTEAIEKLDDKYRNLSERIRSEYEGDEANARIEELKDNYRAVLEGMANCMNETNSSTRSNVEGQERWQSYVPEQSVDVGALYVKCEEADDILSGVLNDVRWKWGNSFDPDNDTAGIKEALLSYEKLTQSVYDEIDRAHGTDPDKRREEARAARKTELYAGKGVYKYEKNDFSNDYDALLDQDTKDFGQTFTHKTTRRNEAAPFTMPDVRLDAIDRLKDTYNRIFASIENASYDEDEKASRQKELDAALMNTVRKNFLSPIYSSATVRANAAPNKMKEIQNQLNYTAEWDVSKLLAGDTLKDRLSDIIGKYLSSHQS